MLVPVTVGQQAAKVIVRPDASSLWISPLVMLWTLLSKRGPTVGRNEVPVGVFAAHRVVGRRRGALNAGLRLRHAQEAGPGREDAREGRGAIGRIIAS